MLQPPRRQLAEPLRPAAIQAHLPCRRPPRRSATTPRLPAAAAHLCPAAHAICHPHGEALVANEESVLPSPVRLCWVRDHACTRLKHQPWHKRAQPAGAAGNGWWQRAREAWRCSSGGSGGRAAALSQPAMRSSARSLLQLHFSSTCSTVTCPLPRRRTAPRPHRGSASHVVGSVATAGLLLACGTGLGSAAPLAACNARCCCRRHSDCGRRAGRLLH